jgi:RES domain-containing protein
VSLASELPTRTLNGRFWHQGPPRFSTLSVADPAVTTGRFHTVGGPGVWYGSDQQQAAWAELFRHTLDGGIDPFEIRRRIGVVQVSGLEVLDLTDRAVRDELAVSEAELVGEDYRPTRQIAADVVDVVGGILSPSAALPGRRTLAVFPAGMARLSEESSRVASAPPRLAGLRPSIRKRAT